MVALAAFMEGLDTSIANVALPHSPAASASAPSASAIPAAPTTSASTLLDYPGFQFIQDPMDYETRTHHSDMDTYDRLHEADLEQAAIVEAIFLWNTSQRDAMMPRKPFPHPEREHDVSAPIANIYPNAQVPPPDSGKPATPPAPQH